MEELNKPSPELLEVNIRQEQEGVTTILLSGVLDNFSYMQLERVFDPLINQHIYKFIVDLSRIDRISSAGVGVFLSKLRLIREKNGNIILINPMPEVMKMFAKLGITQYFTIAKDRQAAMSLFNVLKPRVLVISSRPEFGKNLVGYLSQKNREAISFASAKDILDHLKTNPASILIIETEIPDTEYEEMIKTAKEFKPNLPVIVVSGYLSAETKDKLTKLGVSDFCNKMFGFDYLGAIIEQKLTS
ncbi:MAG: STAS domain-containing protein [Planctomycetes bacterium]|nr:STAS domain-containing protein [Planctomycetota bacterium]